MWLTSIFRALISSMIELPNEKRAIFCGWPGERWLSANPEKTHWNRKTGRWLLKLGDSRQIRNLGHNILELCNVLIQTRLTTSKISIITNLVYEFPHKLPNDLRRRILRNKKIFGKSQIWVETYPSAQSPLQDLNPGSSSQKTRKSRYQTFLVLSSFTRFLYFVPNTLSRIAGDLARMQNKYIIIWNFFLL